MQQDALAPWRRELDLPSERGASRQIMDELLEQLDRHGWSATDKFGIHLAAEEAIVNAILHGNRLDPRKRVHVICTISPDLFRIDITDEGDGFDPALVPDCTQEDRLTVPSGRGVMLMRSFMTRIEYNPAGNAVVLEKRRQPPES